MKKPLILRGTPVHCTINEYGLIWNLNTNREQKPFISNRYKRIKVRIGGGEYLRDYIHRLVAEHFIGLAPEPDMVVNHKDGDRHNNHVDNLEWVTPAENQEHYHRELRHLNRVEDSVNRRVSYETKPEAPPKEAP